MHMQNAPRDLSAAFTCIPSHGTVPSQKHGGTSQQSAWELQTESCVIIRRQREHRDHHTALSITPFCSVALFPILAGDAGVCRCTNEPCSPQTDIISPRSLQRYFSNSVISIHTLGCCLGAHRQTSTAPRSTCSSFNDKCSVWAN